MTLRRICLACAALVLTLSIATYAPTLARACSARPPAATLAPPSSGAVEVSPVSSNFLISGTASIRDAGHGARTGGLAARTPASAKLKHEKACFGVLAWCRVRVQTRWPESADGFGG